MSKAWYILHTFTGHERKVLQRLNLLLEQSELQQSISDVVVPSEQFTEIKNGKKVTRKRIFLPGYLLLEIDFENGQWERICEQLIGIESVTGFVGTQRGTKPTPIHAEEARAILQRVGEIKATASQDAQQSFVEGESVRIIGGSFVSFTGKIDAIDTQKRKLRVLVGIFGRTVSVEVDVTEVEKV